MFRALMALALATTLFASAAEAQVPNLNTTRLSRLGEHNGFNDIWGYTAPDGREYACVGLTDGVSIVNVSDPIEPYEVAFFPGGLCTWRDLKTFDHYLYVVTDCTAGVDVYDMIDPENPVWVNKFGMGGLVQHAHNVAIDTDTGILYAVGTQNGMYVFDLNVDPVDPPNIEFWGPNYIHDVSIQDGVAYAALIWAGDMRLLDVSNPNNITTISVQPSGEQFTHSTWPNADNSVVVAADETLGNRHLAFYDITNQNDPVLIGKHNENTDSIPHNPFIRGDYCFVSWYTEGFIAIDISDPHKPTKVGRYDTQPATDPGGINGFEGAWGCYPFADSGFIYVSDRKRGLFVLNFNDCAIDLPNLAEPQICRVWPDTVSALDSPRQRVILTGAGFTDATAVNVGGTVIGADQYTVIDDQTIHFRMPLVANVGFNDITVTSAQGTSLPMQVEVELPAGPLPMLDTGSPDAVEGETFLVAIGSQPGDLLFPVLAFSEGASVVPGKVAFDIGNGFNDLFFLGSLTATNAGVSGFPMVAPTSSIGLTVYWQSAVVDPQVGLPAAVTNFTSTTFVSGD